MIESYVYMYYAYRKLRKSIRWSNDWFSSTYLGAQVNQGEWEQDQSVNPQSYAGEGILYICVLCAIG